MASGRSRYLVAKIARLARENAAIDRFFYDIQDDDDDSRVFLLQRKRDDLVRSVVMQLHTSIEDLLDSIIINQVLRIKPNQRSSKLRTKSGKALLRLLKGGESIGFSSKLKLALAFRLFREHTMKTLEALNSLRN